MITLKIHYHEFTLVSKESGAKETEDLIQLCHTQGFVMDKTWVSPYVITKIVVS